MPTFSTKQARETFLRDGAVVLRHFFGAAELSAVNAALAEMLKTPPPPIDKLRPDNWQRFDTNPQQLGHLAMDHPAFVALKRHPRLVEMTAALLGSDFEEENLLVQVTPKGTGQAWHQDSLPDNPAVFMSNRLIYPHDVAKGAGQVVFVPGSHKRGLIPSGGPQESMQGEVGIAPEAGMLVFLHAHCFHRVTKNETDTPRVSINFRVRPHGVAAGQGMVAPFRTGVYDFGKSAVVKDRTPSTGK